MTSPVVPADPWRPLTAGEKGRLAVEVTAAYARSRWALSRADVEQAVRAVRGGVGTDGRPVRREEIAFGVRLGEIVERSLRWLPGDTRCLTRSLVLVQLLARRGTAASLVIGVRPGPDFGAHAWVELQGQPLLEPIDAAGQRLIEL